MKTINDLLIGVALVVVSGIYLAGCATLSSPLTQQKERVYDCAVTLIDREISARDAETVCTNIFRRRAEKKAGETSE